MTAESYFIGEPIQYGRLLPPEASYGGDYAKGVTMLTEDSHGNLISLGFTRLDAVRLMNDIDDHFAGRIDIRSADPETGMYAEGHVKGNAQPKQGNPQGCPEAGPQA